VQIKVCLSQCRPRSGELLILVFGAHGIPPRRAGACNTLKEPARGLWGILNKTEQSASYILIG